MSRRAASCRPPVTSTRTFRPSNSAGSGKVCLFCAGGQLHHFLGVRLDGRELPAGLLDERARAEEQLHVHQVVVDLDRVEVLPGEIHALGIDGHFEARLGRGEVALLLAAILRIDDLAALPFDLVDLRDHGREGVAPAIDRMEQVGRRDGAGFLRLVLEEFEVRGAVVVLHPGRHAFRVDPRERIECLVDAILEQAGSRRPRAGRCRRGWGDRSASSGSGGTAGGRRR